MTWTKMLGCDRADRGFDWFSHPSLRLRGRIVSECEGFVAAVPFIDDIILVASVRLGRRWKRVRRKLVKDRNSPRNGRGARSELNNEIVLPSTEGVIKRFTDLVGRPVNRSIQINAVSHQIVIWSGSVKNELLNIEREVSR
jgi:hypothetical protein